jgi:hypothetical protein
MGALRMESSHEIGDAGHAVSFLNTRQESILIALQKEPLSSLVTMYALILASITDLAGLCLIAASSQRIPPETPLPPRSLAQTPVLPSGQSGHHSARMSEYAWIHSKC